MSFKQIYISLWQRIFRSFLLIENTLGSSRALFGASINRTRNNTDVDRDTGSTFKIPSAPLKSEVHMGKAQKNGPGALLDYFIVGIENSAPARKPVGQRAVIVFIRV